MTKGRPRVVAHGTYSEYSNHDCRCRPCKDAARDYERRVRADPDRWAKRLAWQRRKRAARYAWLQQLKLSRGCLDCGYNARAEALDFDHLGDKQFTISNDMGLSKAMLEAEIAKCDVVCANCHRVRTADRRT